MRSANESRQEDSVSQKVNYEKSDLSVSLGRDLRKKFAVACEEDGLSLSQATKECIKRWLASRIRKEQRERKDRIT